MMCVDASQLRVSIIMACVYVGQEKKKKEKKRNHETEKKLSCPSIFWNGEKEKEKKVLVDSEKQPQLITQSKLILFLVLNCLHAK